MLDFWEALGRMATSSDCCTAVYAAVKTNDPGGYPTAAFNPAAGAKFPNIGLQIPSADYTAMRSAVMKYTDGPISMMALGELIMIVADSRFRALNNTLIKAIAASGAKTGPFSKLYYSALGCMLLDSKIRMAFAGDGANFDLNGYSSLTSPERASLTQLALDASVGPDADQVCALYWGVSCADLQTYYDGHLHPVVKVYPI
jgi:hypothetical protein